MPPPAPRAPREPLACRTMASTSPILVYDGLCNLCNASVQWVIARDPRATFRFASLQSEAGRALLARHALRPGAIDTVVLVDGDCVWLKSDAGLEVLRRIGGGFTLLRALRVVPRPLRDALYEWVARNRYRWYGKRAECLAPAPELRERFLS